MQVIVKIITVEPQTQEKQENHEPPTNTSTSSTGVANNASETIPPIIVIGSMPNKSSLFKTNNNITLDSFGGVPNHLSKANASSIGSSTTTSTPQDEAQTSGSVSELKRLLSASASSKPVPNFGKPNLAPKPPGNQLTPGSANGSMPTSPLLQGGAVKGNAVSRHHSMRTPR